MKKRGKRRLAVFVWDQAALGFQKRMFRPDTCGGSSGEEDEGAHKYVTRGASTPKAARRQVLRRARRREKASAAAKSRRRVNNNYSAFSSLAGRMVSSSASHRKSTQTLKEGDHKKRMPLRSSDGVDADNASSATPEEYAVSTMILALENLSPMEKSMLPSSCSAGQMRSSSLPESTPIRGNLSCGQDDDDANASSNMRRTYSTNDAGSNKRSQTRVRFQSRQEEIVVSDSESQVISSKYNSRSKAARVKSAMKKKRGSPVYVTPEHVPRGSPKSRKGGGQSKVRLYYAERDVDDMSVQSDPTMESSMDDSSYKHGSRKRNIRNSNDEDHFLDALLDLVSFDISMDEDTACQFTDDDDTFHSKDDAFRSNQEETVERSRNGTRKKKGAPSSHRRSDTVQVNDNDDRLQSACHGLELPADTGKQVLSDISSVLSFNNEDATSSCHKEGPTEVGMRVISNISSALSLKESSNAKEIQRSDSKDWSKRVESSSRRVESKRSETKRNQEKRSVLKQEESKQGYIPEISYSCSMEEVFQRNMASPPNANPPMERIDSAQLTYISDLSSLANHVPQVDLSSTMVHVSRSFEESKKILESIKSPLSFSGPTQDSPSPDSQESGDEELLKIVDDERATLRTNSQTFTEGMDSLKQLSSSPCFKSLQAMVDSPAPTSESGTETADKQARDDSSPVNSLDGSISKIMAKGKASMNKMSPDRTKEPQVKGSTCDTKGPFEHVLNGFQNIVTCNGAVSKKGKESGDRDFLTSLSQSFSFWGKDSKEDSQAQAPADEMDKSACTPVKRNTSLLEERNRTRSSADLESRNRSFPKASNHGESKIGEDDEGSEGSLEKEVSVTIHTFRLDLSGESEQRASSPAKDDASEENASSDVDNVERKNERKDIKGEPHDETTDAGETKSDDALHAFNASFSTPPASPEYKMPRRPPGKVVKSLQGTETELSKKSQSWHNPALLKVSAVASPRRRASMMQIIQKRMKSPKSSPPTKTVGMASIIALPVTHTPSKVPDDGMESPLLQESEVLEGSKTMNDEISDDTEESELVDSPTWPNADLNTSTDTWQSFQHGELFDSAWSKETRAAPIKKPQVETESKEDPFKVTYKNQSAKWLRIHRASNERKMEQSPKDVTMYGESNPEFNSFGRRSLIEALSGTTQGEF